MSSHHIVREKQEPALLVLGLDSFSDEHLGQMLEWSPTLIAIPATAEKLNAYSIKIDMIIADKLEIALQSDVKFIPLINSPAETALSFLHDAGYTAVNIVTDFFDLAGYDRFTEKINIVIYYDHQKIYPVRPGYSKWKPAGEEVGVLSDISLTTSGLKSIGLRQYITTHDGFFTIRFDAPSLFITETL